MRDKEEKMNLLEGDEDDVMLHQLLYLKSFERPDQSAMLKNRQNIMRRVRQTEHRSWGLGHLLEVNIPWFFAEPRYGIALLFVAFAGLQFWGASVGSHSSDRGIYSRSTVVSLNAEKSVSTNNVVYPALPDNLRFFPERGVGSDVQFVGLVVPEE